MSGVSCLASEFEGHLVHTLIVRGRPAWIAHQLGAVLGYGRSGGRLATKITTDWAEDFAAGRDFAMVVGPELAAVKASCGVVPPTTSALLVLFESGMHVALSRAIGVVGPRLRSFLVDEVLARLETPTPHDVETTTRARRVDLADRRFRSRALKHTADALSELGRIDSGTWAVCLVRACEIALGHPLPILYGPPDQDWHEASTVARRLGVPLPRVYEALTALNLFQRQDYVRAVPREEGAGWTLTFELSPEAAALVEAWIAGLDEPATAHPAA